MDEAGLIELVEETVDLEFTVVWPDGSEEPATEFASFVDEEAPEATDEEHEPYVTDVAPAFTTTDDGDIQFVMPALTLRDESELADARCGLTSWGRGRRRLG